MFGLSWLHLVLYLDLDLDLDLDLLARRLCEDEIRASFFLRLLTKLMRGRK